MSSLKTPRGLPPGFDHATEYQARKNPLISSFSGIRVAPDKIVQKRLHLRQLVLQLQERLASLPEKEAAVIRLRFLSGGDLGLTQKQVGAELGVSEETVGRLEISALERLFVAMVKDGRRAPDPAHVLTLKTPHAWIRPLHRVLLSPNQALLTLCLAESKHGLVEHLVGLHERSQRKLRKIGLLQHRSARGGHGVCLNTNVTRVCVFAPGVRVRTRVLQQPQEQRLDNLWYWELRQMASGP